MPVRKRIFAVLLFAAVLAAAFAVLRYQVIEPEEMAGYCTTERMVPMICRVRAIAIQGFARHLYGPISLALAVLGWIGGSRYLAVLAMVVGMAGAQLYNFEFAGAGLLLGALLLAHDVSDARDAQQQPSQPQAGEQT